MVDLLAALRRPLQRLLHDCSFLQWDNVALFVDGGATEATRWAGGLGFLLEELGISLVFDLQVCILTITSHDLKVSLLLCLCALRCSPMHLCGEQQVTGNSSAHRVVLSVLCVLFVSTDTSSKFAFARLFL